MLEFRNIEKIYKLKNSDEDVVALSNINIAFKESGMVFLVGKSGSGKTTLLNLMAGLDLPSKGEIEYDGKKLVLY